MAHFSQPYPGFFTVAGQNPEIIPSIYHRSLSEGGSPTLRWQQGSGYGCCFVTAH